MKKLILSLIIICLTAACSRNITSTTGYIRPPQNYKFSYASVATRIHNNEIIDTSTVYYLHECPYYKNTTEYKHNDAIIRFFSDGRFKTWSIKDKVTLDDINNIENGVVGFYILEGKKIKMELYLGRQFGYTKMDYGYFDENKNLIVINSDSEKPTDTDLSLEHLKRMVLESTLNPKTYKKTKVNGMQYMRPNW